MNTYFSLKKIKISTYLLLIFAIIVNVQAQKATEVELDQNQTQIVQILESFDSFKYSNIFIFKLQDKAVSLLNDLYGPQPPLWSDPVDSTRVMSEKIKKGSTRQRIKDEVDILFSKWRETDDSEEKKVFEDQITGKSAISYFNFLKDKKNYEEKKINAGYVVTNRYSSPKEIAVIAVMLVTSEAEDEEKAVKEDLKSSNKIIKIRPHLEKDKLRFNEGSSGIVELTAYEYVKNRISQDDAINVTLSAQGINSDSLEFLPKKYGSTYPIKEDNIQQYLRISEGQPINYNGEHELTIGIFDLIRYRHYRKLKKDEVIPLPKSLTEEESNQNDQIEPNASVEDEEIPPIIPQEEKEIFNNYLPLFGAELRYGLPEINYPSLWSERVTLSVLWQSNKLGIILPTRGWSPLVRDFFNVERKLTSAGFGLYGSLDFPIKLLNQGGVFNVNASYVFGDAEVNKVNTDFIFNGRTADQLNDSSSFRNIGISYLPRFHAQFHYSFAINIDNSSYFRFKLGATTYAIQRWIELEKPNGIDPQTNREVIENKNRLSDQYSYEDLSKYNRLDVLSIAAINGLKPTELIAGLSGRIEYYTISETVPWGFAVQYFDGSFSGDLWLQVPIFENFILKSQAQFFQTVFRDPKPWELGTIVIPSIQFIYNF